MQLKQLKIARKFIAFTVVLNPDSNDETAAEEERKVTAKEAPLEDLTNAFAKLPNVICTILELPKDWTAGIVVSQLTLTTTKAGTRSVSFHFKKALDAIGGQLHSMATPFVRIEQPADGESGEQEVSEKDAKLIFAAIRECERYAKGERSQQLLDLDADKEVLNAQVEQGLALV